MPDDLIAVDDKPFLGRVEEQKQFRAALLEVSHSPETENLPYIILLYGDGGIGKTTLAKRYRDIALKEHPFRGKLECLWIDWEHERDLHSSLNVGSQFIRPETVFDVIYTCALRRDWHKHFITYQKALDNRKEAEKRAAEVIASGVEKDDFSALRGAGANAIAKILRTGIPMMGESGEKLAQSFLEVGIKVGAEQAANLRVAIETRLRGKLDIAQYDLFVNPNEGLARALAEGLRSVAKQKSLLLVLDTYEIVDHVDQWLRMVIANAGINVVWIIGGRNDLFKSRGYGDGYFRGYVEEFPRRLLAYDMRQLALEDVKIYFASSVPRRPLSNEEAEAIRRATRGIPLAIKQAAEIWANKIPLNEIVGDTDDATPGKEIVGKMTARYLLHAVKDKEEDKYALFALALARGNVEILRAMLRPDANNYFDLDHLLKRLERDYASVHKESNRLHDEPELFFEEYLKQEIHRTDDRIRLLNQRAVDILKNKIAKSEANLSSIEERCEDDEWIKLVLDLTYHLFWLDEELGWRWVVPRFVEGLAYSRDLRRGLLEAVNAWEKQLSKRGKKRYKIFQEGTGNTIFSLNPKLKLPPLPSLPKFSASGDG